MKPGAPPVRLPASPPAREDADTAAETNAPPQERFPLAAKALRVSNAPPVAPTAQNAKGTQGAAASAKIRSQKNWALYLFVFLLPLQNIHVGYLPNLGGGLNFLNIMFALTLLGALIGRGRMARGQSVNRWVAAYALYSVISLIVGYQFVSDGSTRSNMLKDHLIGLSLLYLVQMSVNDWDSVRRVVLATLLPLPYIAKVVWIQHRDVSSWHYSDDLRISGTFSLLGANEFAAFCVTVAIVLFAILIAARTSKIWRAMLIGGFAFMIMGVMYGYSRTAYISLILGLVTVILAWRGRWKLMVPLLLLSLIAPSILPPSVIERFDSTSLEEGHRDESTEMRFEYWKIAWENFQAHPVTGTGFQTFKALNPYNMDTHNFYLRTLSEGGVIGAVMLLGILIALLRTSAREIKRSRFGTWHYALALGLLGATMAMICSNLFGDRFTYYPVIAYFWVYAGLVLKAPMLPMEEEPKR